MAQFLGAKGFRDLQENGPHPDALKSKTFLHKNSSRLLNKYHLVIYKLKTSIASAAVICMCHAMLLIRHAIIKGVAFNCQKGS